MFNKTTIIGLIFLIWNFPLFSQIEESNLIKIQNVDSTQMNALTPEVGTLIYNSEDKYLYRFDGLNWLPIIKDNLGNHIATENIKLDGHWLSNDGDNEGIFVDPSGKIGIGTNTPIIGN